MSEYDRKKDVEIARFFSKVENRYLNCKVYNYDGGGVKLSITPASKNTNPNCEKKKEWLKAKGISGITKEEASLLVVAINRCIEKM